jgi:hypothetical protein
VDQKLKDYNYYEDSNFRLFFLKYINDVGQFIKACEESEEWFNFSKRMEPLDFIKAAIILYKSDNTLRPVDLPIVRIVSSPFDELYDFLKSPSPFDIRIEPFKTLNEIFNGDMLDIVENVKNKKLDFQTSIKKIREEITVYHNNLIDEQFNG